MLNITSLDIHLMLDNDAQVQLSRHCHNNFWCKPYSLKLVWH